jgi:hypothetical protein
MRRKRFIAFIRASFLLVLVIVPTWAWADDLNGSSQLELGGKFGVEKDTIPINFGINNGDGDYTAIGLDYWFSNKSALQLLGFVNFYSNPAEDFNGSRVYDSSQAWGTGLGYKYNFREPFHGLFIQLLGRVTYAQAKSTSHNTQSNTTAYSETLSFFGGVGFEFFIPFWQALSISANVGYQLSYDDGWSLTLNNPIYFSAASVYQPYRYFEGGIVSNGFTLDTLSITFYF